MSQNENKVGVCYTSAPHAVCRTPCLTTYRLLPDMELECSSLVLPVPLIKTPLVIVCMSETGGSADGTRSLRVTHTNLMLIL